MTQSSTPTIQSIGSTIRGIAAARAIFLYAGLITVGTLTLSGCERTSGIFPGDRLPNRQRPISIEPAPLSPVQQGELAPLNPQDQQSVPGFPDGDDTEEVVDTAASADAKPLTRQAMVGAWTVTTGGSSCQIFLALTKWSGGYRAASRGCSAASLSDVQAWDVQAKQVVLVNSSGDTAATLYRSSEQRYDGSTSSGGAISFIR